MSLFHETQRFRQPWILALVAVLAAVGWGAFVQQIVRGQTIGNDPASDAMVWVLAVILGIGLPLFTWLLRLETDVSFDHVEIALRPFNRRVIPASEIVKAEARTYHALREFGGWGIRGWGDNRAYNVSGDRGVQLLLTNGNRVLIGSEQPDELAAAIRSVLIR